MTGLVEGAVTCAAPAAKCRCGEPAGHVEAGDPVHACADEGCGGSWTGEHHTDTFVVVVYPGGFTDPVSALLVALFGGDE